MLFQDLLDWARDRFHLIQRAAETVFCHIIISFVQHVNKLFGATQWLPVKSSIIGRIAVKTVGQNIMENLSILKIFWLITLLVVL